MSSEFAVEVREIGAGLIDVSLVGPAADGDGRAPVLGQGLALPAEQWQELLPRIGEAVGRAELGLIALPGLANAGRASA